MKRDTHPCLGLAPLHLANYFESLYLCFCGREKPCVCVCVGGAIGQKQPKPCACVCRFNRALFHCLHRHAGGSRANKHACQCSPCSTATASLMCDSHGQPQCRRDGTAVVLRPWFDCVDRHVYLLICVRRSNVFNGRVQLSFQLCHRSTDTAIQSRRYKTLQAR